MPSDDEIKNKNQPTSQEKTATTTFVPSPAVNADNMESNKTCWV